MREKNEGTFKFPVQQREPDGEGGGGKEEEGEGLKMDYTNGLLSTPWMEETTDICQAGTDNHIFLCTYNTIYYRKISTYLSILFKTWYLCAVCQEPNNLFS